MAVRFPISCVSPSGRTARGVIAIRPEEGDFVAGAVVVDSSKQLITITERGFGKRCEFEEFALHNRGGKGMRCHNITEKTGLIAGIAAVDVEDDIIFITSEGTVMRTGISEIPVYSRTAGGVIVMRISDDTVISNFTVVPKEPDEPDDPESAENSDAEGVSEGENTSEPAENQEGQNSPDTAGAEGTAGTEDAE